MGEGGVEGTWPGEALAAILREYRLWRSPSPLS